MVSTLDFHPDDRGSNPIVSTNFFVFFSFNFAKNQVLFIKKTQNSTQKLLVQFHFFKHFQYASITYDKKMESKVLGNLLLITINFLTVWSGGLSMTTTV